MPLPLSALFLCLAPAAVDGDTLRCEGVGLVRLIGIDAPELPGHCRPGRVCTPGDPRASRASLARLVRAPVTCEAAGRDGYGRVLARCSTPAGDLSCAMIAAGQAVARYSPIRCAPR